MTDKEVALAGFLVKQTADDCIVVIRNTRGACLTIAQAERYILANWFGETPPNVIYIEVKGTRTTSRYMTQNVCGKVRTLEKYE